MKTRKNILMILFGFVMWPIIIATPRVVNAYVQKLITSEIEFREIPQFELMTGLLSGVFAALIFIGISYLLAFIVSKFRKNSTFNGATMFFIITCLGTLLLVTSYGSKVIEALSFEKENVENIQDRIKKLED
jgi:uncharacterized membrane protein (UPF0182 family)